MLSSLDFSSVFQGVSLVTGPLTLIAFIGALITVRSMARDRERRELAKAGRVDVISTVIQGAPGFDLTQLPNADRATVALAILRQHSRRHLFWLLFWLVLVGLLVVATIVFANSGDEKPKPVSCDDFSGMRLADLAKQIAPVDGPYARGVVRTVETAAREYLPTYEPSSSGPSERSELAFVQDVDGLIKIQRIRLHSGARRIKARSTQVRDDPSSDYYASVRVFSSNDGKVFHELAYQAQDDYPHFRLDSAAATDAYVVALYPRVCVFESAREGVSVEIDDLGGISSMMLAFGGSLEDPVLSSGFQNISPRECPVRLSSLGTRARNVPSDTAIPTLVSTFDGFLTFLSQQPQHAFADAAKRVRTALASGQWAAIELRELVQDVHFILDGKLSFERKPACAL